MADILRQNFREIIIHNSDLPNWNEYHQIMRYMNDNWQIPLITVSLYALFIFIGPLYMSTRNPIRPKFLLFLWNVFLSIFSIGGFISVVPIFFWGKQSGLFTQGLIKSICTDPNLIYWEGNHGYFSMLFVFSKFPELIDTFWLIIGKRRLIFLHWYHHITVLLYCWYSYIAQMSVAAPFGTMNYFVHSIMYSYYALTQTTDNIKKAIRPYGVYITILQLLQMFFGVSFTISAFYLQNQGTECHSHIGGLKLALLMYCSYFILFFQILIQKISERTSKFKKLIT